MIGNVGGFVLLALAGSAIGDAVARADSMTVLLWALGGKAAVEGWLAVWIVRRLGDVSERVGSLGERIARLEGRLDQGPTGS